MSDLMEDVLMSSPPRVKRTSESHRNVHSQEIHDFATW